MERNIIQFKGIVRNTPGSSSEDGQFDEVQNLRFRDGAWRPVLDPLPLKDYEDGEHSKAGQYVTHYIHATGDYKHLLGIDKDDHKLYWIADLSVHEDDPDEVICQWRQQPQEIASCSENARMVTNGNMCTFVSQEDFFHIFFRASGSEQRYVVLGGMLTEGLSATEISPDYAPALRVKGWVVDKDRYPEQWNDERSDAANWKDKRGCKVYRVYRFNIGDEIGEQSESLTGCYDGIEMNYKSHLLEILDKEKNEGFLHGFFWACTALKMYDGTYILHSRPVLMQQAADQQIRFGSIGLVSSYFNDDEGSPIIYKTQDSEFFTENPFYGFFYDITKLDNIASDYKIVGNGKLDNYVDNGSDVIGNYWDVIHNSDSFAGGYNSSNKYPGFIIVSRQNPNIGITDDSYNQFTWGNFLYFDSKNIAQTELNPYNLLTPREVKTADNLAPNFLLETAISSNSIRNRFFSYDFNQIITTHNILQFRADKMIDESYKNVVQGVSFFLTPQVYMQDPDKTKKLVPNVTDLYTTFINMLPQYSVIQDIREQLLHQRNFYKVKEFTWDEYQQLVGKGWVTIDLKDVLSTLTEQEQLNIDSYTRSEYFSSVCQYYNGKLHIANYKENSFSGWPATYFKSEGYNYIADNYTAAMKIADKARGQGNSADKKINIAPYDYIREGGSSLPSAARSFYKHHDGTQTLEIGTAGAAQAAWEREGIDIDEAEFNKFLQERLHEIRLQIDVTTVNEEEEEKTYTRRTPLSYFSDLRLNAMLSFPDIRATKMKLTTYMNTDVRLNGRYVRKWYNVFEKTYTLDTDNGFNLAIYLSEDLCHIWAADWSKIRQLVNQSGGFLDEWTDELPEIPTTNASEYPNQLKVSEVNNPLYYPPENTYVVSNGSILAMENDSISMQAGQYGTSPLYVFSSDGIYGLMVDASGELTYTNSRCVARDVVSDPHAIESTEAGVLFPTRHGLMSISNQVVTELSEPVEGPVVPWFDPRNIEKLPQAQVAAGLCGIRSNADEDGNPQPVFKFGDGALSYADEEFKTFVQGAVIGYNYIDKEIWVSKRGQGTYVLTRSGWTRLSVEADKYVADFPHYYLQRDNRLYWLGREKTEETVTGEDGTAESKKLAASCYFITRPVKLGSEDYKQALRLVLRCRLECEEGQMSSLLVWGSYDSRKWTCLGGIDRVGSVKDIGKVVNRTDCKYFRFAFFGRLQAGSVIDYAELGSERRLYSNKIR